MYEWVIFFLTVVPIIGVEFYSSLGHMEDLVKEELNLISSLKDFISAEETRIERMKEVASGLKSHAVEANDNIEKFLGHPVNQYLFMRQLKSEYDTMESLVSKNTTFLGQLRDIRPNLPGDEDVQGTAKALMRLQDTYDLDTHDLAQGKVKSSYAGRKLTADDCFQIGRTAYIGADYYHCVLWMNEADDKIQQGDTTHERFDVLDHLAFSLSQQGNWKRAYELTIEMLKINPQHDRIKQNRDYYRNLLKSTKKGDEGEVEKVDYSKWSAKLKREDKLKPKGDLYQKLCREGGEPISPQIEKNLKCYYWDNNDPLLRIQPIKIEELWKAPHLVRFYDIINEKEIDTIKAMAKPRLNRATVQNPATGILEPADYRVSKSAWLQDKESNVIRRISARIAAATGLSMKSAEDLQIANYGVGGQYETHYDFVRSSDKRTFDENVGNRIATMLFYLTNVEYGGATIFLTAKVAVKPIKGSAVFWYNLYPSGEGDLRTNHAACPVLNGVKWVANKWIHERDQEFKRSCALDKNAENSIF
uniref:prolyl 4-hydroxylase subunit alpha-1-like n=1 Tax=Styela clava TaxID=7725 RepID=UPI00193A65B1|nr:prolyl 4-hydroxylase subunit alpha-1-like [Styela clava]